MFHRLALHRIHALHVAQVAQQCPGTVHKLGSQRIRPLRLVFRHQRKQIAHIIQHVQGAFEHSRVGVVGEVHAEELVVVRGNWKKY